MVPNRAHMEMLSSQYCHCHIGGVTSTAGMFWSAMSPYHMQRLRWRSQTKISNGSVGLLPCPFLPHNLPGQKPKSLSAPPSQYAENVRIEWLAAQIALRYGRAIM